MTGARSASQRPNDMKEKIHPKYYEDAVVICSCGNKFTTGSTKKELKVEICSICHPFFTGERRMLDTTGRVERFKKRYKIEG
jgi:large subunit ribosomal protein L31